MTRASAWDEIGAEYRHEPVRTDVEHRHEPADAEHRHESANPVPRPRIKRGLLGATARSVEDALAARDYEMAMLRRDHRELRWAAEVLEGELNRRLDEVRRHSQEREKELNVRLANVDETARTRYEELRSDYETLRSRFEELQRIVAATGAGQDSAPGQSRPDRSRGAGLKAVPAELGS